MKTTIVLTAAVILICTAQGLATLLWYQDGQPIDEVTVELGRRITVQLHSDIPSYHPYRVTMGTGVPIIPGAVHGVGIPEVEPLLLAGDRAEVIPLLGAVNVSLHCEWVAGPIPISHWGDHWDVTLEGLRLGAYPVHSDWGQAEGPDDILTVNVVPEPAGLVLLALGARALQRRRSGGHGAG